MYRVLCTDRFSYDLTIFYACHVPAEQSNLCIILILPNTKPKEVYHLEDVLNFEPHAKYGFISIDGGHIVANESPFGSFWSAHISLFHPKKKPPRPPQMLKDWPIYLHYHRFRPNVGRYAIHGASSNLSCKNCQEEVTKLLWEAGAENLPNDRGYLPETWVAWGQGFVGWK